MSGWGSRNQFARVSLGVWITSAALAVSAAFDVRGEEGSNPVKELPDNSIYQISGVWTDQNGKKRQLADFAGKPQIMAMVFTSCQYVCPRLVSDIIALERKLSDPEKDKIGFLLLSIDPERDTPSVLRSFAEKRGIDLQRWTLLTAPKSLVHTTALALGVQYKQEINKDFSHSNLITILDRQGTIRQQVVGFNQNAQDTLRILQDLTR